MEKRSKGVLLFSTCIYLLCKPMCCTDPCSSYTDLNDATRLVSYNLPFGNVPACDRYDITERWYRFSGDRNVPTFAPDPGNCGTNAPVWIDGTLPANDGDVKTMKACKVGFLDQCEASWNVDVKNCGLFNIFQLVPIASCEGRYCMDEAQPCPEGTSSDSGFPPCTVNVINVTLSGYVYPSPFIPTYDPTSPDRMLMFRCDHWIWMLDTTIDYHSLLYDVRWDIEKEEFLVKSNLSYSQIETDGVLKSSEWKDRDRKMGIEINCAIRGRLNEYDTPSPYLEGRGYFVGINISPKTLTITSGKNAQVGLYPTVPIACVYNSSVPCKLNIEMFDFSEQFSSESQMYCNNSIAEFTKPSLCGLEIDGWKRWYYHPMNVTVPANANPNQEYTAVLKLRSSGLSYDNLWHDYHLDPITIQVVNDNLTDRYWYWNYAWCSSATDPWFWTFDSNWYTFNDEGEFVLFKHKTKPIEVHTIQRKFNSDDSWTENCAVAIRAASDVFIIYGCGRPTKWIIRRLNCKAGADYLKVYHRWDSYEIQLPSGTIVSVYKASNRRLNINIMLSRSDREDAQGMCGNWNDNYQDDFTARDGTIMENSTLFARSWRVPSSGSLFVAKPREETLSISHMYCACLGETLGKLSPDVDCSWQENIPSCPPLNWDHKACEIRSKRSVDADDDEIFDVPLDIVNHREHPELNTNWKNGWNESSAETTCLKRFMESPVYETCKTFGGVNISADLTTCITNIRTSGTTEFVYDSLESIISQCSVNLRVNTSLHDLADENGTNIFDTIINNICPNDCQYRGVKTGDCVNGFCTCFDGYIGDDCRIHMNSPPVVSGLSEEYVCDSSIKGCNAFSIYGDGFYSSDKLKCRIRPGKITETSIISDGSHITTTATYKNNGEIKCDIGALRRRRKRSTDSSSATHVYLVSVTTNGNDYSDEVPVVIYDSDCLECAITNLTVLCNIKSDVCVTDDTCQSKNTSSCETDNEDVKNSESANKLWIMAVIIGMMVVIIVIVLLVKWKKHERILIIPFCQPKPRSKSNDYINNVYDYDTISEKTMGSTMSLQNTPPISTERIFCREQTMIEDR